MEGVQEVGYAKELGVAGGVQEIGYAKELGVEGGESRG